VSHLDQHLARGLSAVLDNQHGYSAYCEQRLLGLPHDQVAHFYGARAAEYQARYVEALNAGARAADDARKGEPAWPQRHQSPAGEFYRDGQ
jgi:hypothetical protein